MPVNVALGHASNAFLIAALVLYSLSVVAFAGDFAFGRPRRAAAAAHGQQAQDRAAALASVGASAAAGAAADQPPAPAAARRLRPLTTPEQCPSARYPRCARSARPGGGSWPRWRSP